jgi:hypothetical protein
MKLKEIMTKGALLPELCRVIPGEIIPYSSIVRWHSVPDYPKKVETEIRVTVAVVKLYFYCYKKNFYGIASMGYSKCRVLSKFDIESVLFAPEILDSMEDDLDKVKMLINFFEADWRSEIRFDELRKCLTGIDKRETFLFGLNSLEDLNTIVREIPTMNPERFLEFVLERTLDHEEFNVSENNKERTEDTRIEDH